MKKLKIFRIIIKPFIGRGIGYKSSFLRNLFYRQFSRLAVNFLSPITIPGGNKLHLPPNGIDYLIGPYEEFQTELMRKNIKPGGYLFRPWGGHRIPHNNYIKNYWRQRKGCLF